MMRLSARRGRPLAVLVFLAVLVVTVAALVGVAQGSSSTTALPTKPTRSVSFTVDADDLGGFALDAPKISSPSAIVINMGTGRVLYEWDAYVRRPMASTTKIMTAVLVLEQMDLSKSIRISEKVAATYEPKVWLRTGDVLTVEQLLYALMVRSANSAAVALAEACFGSVEAFVEEMNAKAAELGMKDTHFANPHGLDAEDHYSTAADMAVVARYAMKDPIFQRLVSTEEYSVSVGGRDEPIVFKNTNALLGRFDWVTGVKTGLTPRAEQCLVCSGTLDGVSIISVVLGQPASEVCWTESRTLMEYGFAQYRHVTLLEEGAVVAEAEVPYQIDSVVRLVTATPTELELYKSDSVTASIVVDRDLILPVSQGEVFGHVFMTIDGEVLETIDLVADKSFEKTTLGGKITYLFRRLGN